VTSLPGLRARRAVPSHRPPLGLVLLAAVVAALAVVPLIHLGLRVVDGGVESLQPLLRPRTVELLISTLVLGLAVTAGAVGLGLPLAWLTTRTDLPARRAWSILAVAPMAIPSYLLAFSFVAALAPRGWLAELLAPLGITATPSSYGFGGAAMVLTLTTAPYVVISVRAALARLDPAADEAARSLGRGPWAAARVAVMPVILPALGAGALVACLYAISDFGAVSILRYDTLATAIYSQYRLSFDRSAASALALLLLLMALSLVWAEGRVRRRAALQVPHGARRAPRVVSLGRWRWPALGLCAALTVLSLVVPSVTIASWLASGLRRAPQLWDALDALRDSLLLASAVALLALVVAVPLSWLLTHVPGRTSSATERLLYGIYAIPGISLALALVSLTLNVAPVLYQTLFALILAVALRFLIQSVGALRGPWLQISPHTREAARSLGERPLGVLRTITLPLLKPGLLAGFAVVFLSTLKELPLTLLLAPAGFSTLATDLWDSAREAFYGQAAVPATLLLLISFLSVALLMRRGDVQA